MSVFAKDTVYGLEYEIKSIQEYLFSNIPWLGSDAEKEVYGLVYRIDSQEGIKPEAYIGTGTNNKEYSQIFINDRVSYTIGFIETGDREILNQRNSDVNIICTMRLDRCFASGSRDTELALLQFEAILNDYFGINKVQSIKLGIDNVFSGFYTDGIKYRDMYPWFVFSMLVNIKYYSTNRCNIGV